VKESFAAVNSAIDAIKQQCEKYLTSDVELRQRLRQESKRAILDEFKKFYEKFAHKEFTKHREKYIRYEPPQFESILENFF
jgi:exocyst complex component 7